MYVVVHGLMCAGALYLPTYLHTYRECRICKLAVFTGSVSDIHAVLLQ